jgi:AcrR family transcriptional regulator
MRETRRVPLNGRRAQAARNDELILEAARTVFTADPEAPISAVAALAGVGISALYRRYRSKEELLQRLASDGMRRHVAEAEAALADGRDAWTAFAEFMYRSVDNGTGALTLRLAGTFALTEGLRRDGRAAYDATQRVLDRTRAARALRPGVEVADVSLLLEQLQAVQLGGTERTGQLRRRYLALLLDGLRDPSAPPLPGPAPTLEEVSRRYEG